MEKQPKFDYSDIKFKDNGKLKLIIVVGTRPEIIRCLLYTSPSPRD